MAKPPLASLPRCISISGIFSKIFHNSTSCRLPRSSGLRTLLTIARSSQNAQRPGLVTITGFNQLSSLFTELEVCPSLASPVKGFQYNNDVDPLAIAFKRTQCNADITYILEQFTQRGRLESFEWYDDGEHYELENAIEPRPQSFWTALAGAAGTLKHLSFRFAVYELSSGRDLKLFPLPFKDLLTLHLDLSNSYGADASQIDQLLHHSTGKLTSLSLGLPDCTINTCRLRGLNYNHQFPNLRAFSLCGHVESGPEVADFLLRNPSIKIVHLGIDGPWQNDDTKIAATSLPNLRAISIDKRQGIAPRLTTQLLSLSASRHITHLRLQERGESAVEAIANAGRSLRCLELSNFRLTEWRQDANNLPVMKFLHDLPELLEVATLIPEYLDSFPSYDSELIAPLDVNDLRRLLASFPPTTKLRAVRMSDVYGLPLPPDFLADLSDVAPPSLEYIRWEVDNKPVLYKLEKTADGRIQAHESNHVRRLSPTLRPDEWTNASILDHVD